jgi:hypothetical protein
VTGRERHGAPLDREAWQKANRVALACEIGAVQALLSGEEPRPAEPDPAPGPGFRSALDVLCDTFGLTGFERQVLVLCAGMQIDADLAARVGRPAATFGTALAWLADPHWSALSPWSPLRHWHLVELDPGPLTGAPVRADEWVVHVLVGTGGLDHRLAGLLRPVSGPEQVPASARAAAAGLAAAWTGRSGVPVVLLRGADPAARRTVFAEACRRLGWRSYALDASDLPSAAAERETLLRRWEREAMYDPAALLIEAGADAEDPALRRVTDRFVAGLAMPAAVAVDALGRAGARAFPGVDVVRPTAAEQRAQWQAALGEDGGFGALNGALDRLVAQFDLDVDAIGTAARAARGADPAADPERRIWEACRINARGGLDELAVRVESAAGFEDLVLPPPQLALLRDMVAHVRHRSLVYGAWGMAGPSASGLGVTALFAGPSGTGKTLAAGVVANALGLDLYRIDLSQAVSKYIGETEKNLRRIFAAASDSGAVLLFDEADALFGKRGDVRESHDRYANMEVSYLLQAMEAYRGLAVLTTNLRSSIDAAFLRRIRFVVEFPFPGPAERAEIWRRAFPATAPTRGLRMEQLAQLSVAGGGIRNIAVQAAFAAADAGVPIGMEQVLHAAAAEYGKHLRSLTDAETRGWR